MAQTLIMLSIYSSKSPLRPSYHMHRPHSISKIDFSANKKVTQIHTFFPVLFELIIVVRCYQYF